MSKSVNRSFCAPVLVALLTLAACATEFLPSDPQVDAAMASISAADIAQHTRILASDEFEGRAPSSPGEELTVEYLRDQFRSMGLEPGNGGSWYQEVPLVSITADPSMILAIERGRDRESLYSYGEDFIAWTTRVVEGTELSASELVVVG